MYMYYNGDETALNFDRNIEMISTLTNSKDETSQYSCTVSEIQHSAKVELLIQLSDAMTQSMR